MKIQHGEWMANNELI